MAAVLLLGCSVLGVAVPGTAGAAAVASGAAGAATAASDGVLSGTVTDHLGRPVAGASVWSAAVGSSTPHLGRTADDGRYQVTGLPAGPYSVEVRVPDGVNLVPWRTDAPVTVTAGGTTALDVRMAPGGLVTGRVTDARGLGVAGVQVSAGGGPVGGALTTRFARTAQDGGYTVAGLPAGDYRVGFAAGLGARTLHEFYDDRGTWDAARPVPVSVGATTGGVDASLPVPGVLALEPTRLLDDRAVAPGTPRCVPVSPRAGVPGWATGVLVNVTTVSPSGPGHVVVYPDSDGSGRTPAPDGSTVNFDPGVDVANAAFVALPANGQVCYATRGAASAGIILDVTGYGTAGSGMQTRSPVRLLDTRPGADHVGDVTGPLAPRTPTTVQVTGRAGVPDGATGVLVNVTVTGARAPGNLRVHAAGLPVPNASTVNYVPGRDKASATIVALSPDGRLSLWSDTAAGTATNPVHVVLDVVGWTTVDSDHVPVTPTRVVDTRAGAVVGPLRGPLAGNAVHSIPVRGVGPVPAAATAVVLTVTAIGPTTAGNLRVYPDMGATGLTPPRDASTLNYIPGADTANLVVVGLPDNGRVNVYSDQAPGGTVQLAADVVGYVTGG